MTGVVPGRLELRRLEFVSTPVLALELALISDSDVVVFSGIRMAAAILYGIFSIYIELFLKWEGIQVSEIARASQEVSLRKLISFTCGFSDLPEPLQVISSLELSLSTLFPLVLSLCL